jgi:hypothetical protein
MTTEQKHNIGRGVKLARQRKRRSDAMKASWARRRNTDTMVEEYNKRDVENTEHILRLTNTNSSELFDQLEQLAITWKGLDAQRWQVSSTPQLAPIIQDAIDRIRLEIILICQAKIQPST